MAFLLPLNGCLKPRLPVSRRGTLGLPSLSRRVDKEGMLGPEGGAVPSVEAESDEDADGGGGGAEGDAAGYWD